MKSLRFKFPRKIQPKARPRAAPCASCGTKPRVYSDPVYDVWKSTEIEQLHWTMLPKFRKAGLVPPIPKDQYVGIRAHITKDGADVEVFPIIGSEHKERKSVPGDWDNLAGAICDALEQAGVIENDRQVVYGEVTIT